MTLQGIEKKLSDVLNVCGLAVEYWFLGMSRKNALEYARIEVYGFKENKL